MNPKFKEAQATADEHLSSSSSSSRIYFILIILSTNAFVVIDKETCKCKYNELLYYSKVGDIELK